MRCRTRCNCRIGGPHHNTCLTTVPLHPTHQDTPPRHLHGVIVGTSSLPTWLESCIVAPCDVTGLEQDYALPGLRMVVCEVRRHLYGSDSSEPEPTRSGWVRHLSTLQLNTGLSKCYLADSLRSTVGLKRGGFYREESVIPTLVEQFPWTFHGPDMKDEVTCGRAAALRRSVRHAVRRQGCSAVDRQSMGRRNTRLATAGASGTPIRTLSPIGAWHQQAWRRSVLEFTRKRKWPFSTCLR